MEKQSYTLQPRQELRIEAQEDIVTVSVVEGIVELFGTELALNMAYDFQNTSIALFSWHGCKISVTSPSSRTVIYVAENNAMISYLNIHENLNKMRRNAVKDQTHGPRVMIVGDHGVGKTTISRILCSYATRSGWSPTYMDLDPSSGGLMDLVPGCIGIVPVDAPIGSLASSSGNRGGSQINALSRLTVKSPLFYFLGHENPSNNEAYWHSLTEALEKSLSRREGVLSNKEQYENENNVFDDKPKFEPPTSTLPKSSTCAGCIIDAGTWSSSSSSVPLVVATAKALRVDVILVVDDERLAALLTNHTKTNVTDKFIVTKIPKSGGVVRLSNEAIQSRASRRIREYFYGNQNQNIGMSTLEPCSRTIKADHLILLSTQETLNAPSTALPLGSTSLLKASVLSLTHASEELENSLVALSVATDEDEAATAPVAGFIYLRQVVDSAVSHSSAGSSAYLGLQKDKDLICLLPNIHPIPHIITLVGSIKWFDV